MKTKLVILVISACCLIISCKNADTKKLSLFSPGSFDTTMAGKKVSLYTLESGNGLVMQVTNYGGRIVSLWVPDRNGKQEDVVLGFGSIAGYINNHGEKYLGPAVGRYANRISGGKFTIDGTVYQLPLNDHGNCLHGGIDGFDSRVWDVDSVSGNFIRMNLVSPDGDQGFPGTVKVSMVYHLSTDNQLIISYKATTDKPTHINLTNHSQFNLKGAGNGTILNHVLTLNASKITPVDSLLIPTGELASVKGTPFDFSVPTPIGNRIDMINDQLIKGKGYDHNWVVNRKTAGAIEYVATLYEPVGGRVMEVWSDQPGIQVYTGNFFTGKVLGKYGKPLLYRGAVAFETQKFPDTPHHPNFPATLVKPGETYSHICIYKFSVKK